MTTNKVLIVDDKDPAEEFSSVKLMAQLNKEQKALVDFYPSTQSLWRESQDGDNIELLKDFSVYSHIFIHDSFDNPLVHDGLRPVLIERLSATSIVIMFSGSKPETRKPQPVLTDKLIAPHTRHYEIIRRKYFNNFRKFLDAGILFPVYDLAYLFDSYADPRVDYAYSLIDSVKDALEKSAATAIQSTAFQNLLDLYHVKDQDLVKKSLVAKGKSKIIEYLEYLIES